MEGEEEVAAEGDLLMLRFQYTLIVLAWFVNVIIYSMEGH